MPQIMVVNRMAAAAAVNCTADMKLAVFDVAASATRYRRCELITFRWARNMLTRSLRGRKSQILNQKFGSQPIQFIQ